MKKIWLNRYPPGVPALIHPEAYASLVALIENSIARYADCPAFYHLGTTLTFHDIDKKSRALAAYFQNVLQLKKGDRLAMMLPNTLQYPITLIAALRLGLIVVNVNPLYTPDELVAQLNDAGAHTLVVLSNVAYTVQQALPRLTSVQHIIVTRLTDTHAWFKRHLLQVIINKRHPIQPWVLPNAILYGKALNEGRRLTLKPVAVNHDDIAFLQYTGGTTGISKGAILTHRNLVANLEQVEAWVGQTLQNGKEIIITALPMYHIFSLLANCLLFIKKGGLNVLITNPKDIDRLIKEMRQFKFTAITGVNTLFAALLREEQFQQLDFRALHFAMGGGMAVQAAVAEAWQKVTRTPLLEGYGLTETSPCVTVNPCDLKQYNGSIGLPLPSTEVELLDDKGQPVPLGQAGELAVKGPQVMQGYWNNAAETKKSFTAEGFLLTGDMAVMDDQGFIRLLERKKDMILVSGFNVYPNEIEQVLIRMPHVRECAVVGVADPQTGEAVKAFVVTDNPSLTASDVMQYCRQSLTAYKVPKLVEFRDILPKSHVGKILRRALKT